MGTPPIFPYGNTGGEGDAIIRFLCCGHFLTCHFDTPPYIFLATKHPVKLRKTAKEEGAIFITIVTAMQRAKTIETDSLHKRRQSILNTNHYVISEIQASNLQE